MYFEYEVKDSDFKVEKFNNSANDCILIINYTVQ